MTIVKVKALIQNKMIDKYVEVPDSLWRLALIEKKKCRKFFLWHWATKNEYWRLFNYISNKLETKIDECLERVHIVK